MTVQQAKKHIIAGTEKMALKGLAKAVYVGRDKPGEALTMKNLEDKEKNRSRQSTYISGE